MKVRHVPSIWAGEVANYLTTYSRSMQKHAPKKLLQEKDAYMVVK